MNQLLLNFKSTNLQLMAEVTPFNKSKRNTFPAPLRVYKYRIMLKLLMVLNSGRSHNGSEGGGAPLRVEAYLMVEFRYTLKKTAAKMNLLLVFKVHRCSNFSTCYSILHSKGFSNSLLCPSPPESC